MKTLPPVLALSLTAGAALAADGLRIASWNITNYGGGSASTIQNVVYGEFNGRKMDPDLFLLQEFASQSALNAFVSALNSAAGSPGDWAGATFVGGGGGGINTCLAYRTSKLDLLDTTIVSLGSSSANPRNIIRYDLRLDGYQAEETVLAVYSLHMKAGSGSSDQSRRLIEADKVRTDAEQLPEGRNIIVGGDFNIQSAFQAAYIELTGGQQNDRGRVLDPIAAPGVWNNSFVYRNIHTQDPVGGGGMDDRLDQILLSPSLGDGIGLDYAGLFGVPWNLNTPEDPNHSYRCWGNDGTSFNQRMTTTGNTMVGPSIAQSIITMGGPTGHCPVYLDLVVPAKIEASTGVIDFGSVTQGDAAIASIEVTNAADPAVWGTAGIQDLQYEFITTGGISAATGVFFDEPGGTGIPHNILADTSVVGPISGTLVIASNDPDVPNLEFVISGEVVAPADCVADIAPPFGILDLADINAFTTGFIAGDPIADLAAPAGVFDLSDINAFVDSFAAGCP